MATCPTCGTQYGPTVRICTHDGTVLGDEPQHHDPQVGKVLDGKYRLDTFLSQGGMGSVYKATHIMLGKTVAVKLIKPELVTSADIVRRFQREARAASNLNHPNIVAVYDLGQADDGTLYIAMEFIEGPSLKDVIRKTGPLPPGRTVRILRQVASALSLAHGHNIIHRDLKPHNIMLAAGPGGQDLPKLVDFGIAKTFDDAATQLTATGFALGTPQYMSPEQAAGKEVDARSDLYSLGVILYEMLTGDVPFNDPSLPVVLVKQMSEMPELPSRRNPAAGVPPDLEAVAMRCLQKDPAERYPNADAFAAALEQCEAGAAHASLADVPTRLMTPPEAAPTRVAAAAPTVAAGPPSPAPAAPAQAPGEAAPAPTVAPTSPSSPTAPPPPFAASAPAAPAPPESQTATGTRATVAAAAPAAGSAADAAPRRSGGAVIWIGLGAAAVLLIGLAMLVQRGGFQTGAPGTSGPAPTASSAPPASPAAADGAVPPPTAAPAPPPAPLTPEAARAGAAADRVPVAAAPQPAAPDVATAAARRGTPPAPPAASAPSGPVAASTPRANSAPAPGAQAPARPAAAAGAAAPPPTAAVPPPAAALPENPPVFFRCSGESSVCGAIRSSMSDSLERNNLPAVRDAGRALILLSATVEVLQEGVNRDFGTTFATRTYSVEVTGESKDGRAISMPGPRTFSFDAQFGRERLEENSRLIARDVVERIREFWKKRTD